MAKMKKVSDSYTAYAKPGAKLKKGANGLMSTTTPGMRASRARMAGERAEAPMRRKARAAAAMASAPMMKKGGSFPDLNKDGKITKADILKGRGVIAKSGSKIKKAQNGQPVLKPSMTIKKSKLDSILNKRKASMDSTKADFNRRLEKAKTPKKMMGGGKCRGGCY